MKNKVYSEQEMERREVEVEVEVGDISSDPVKRCLRRIAVPHRGGEPSHRDQGLPRSRVI